MSYSGGETERFANLIAEVDAVEVGSLDPEILKNERLSDVVVALERVRTKLEAASLRFLKVWKKVTNALQHLCDADWTRSHRTKRDGEGDAAASAPRDDRTFTQRQADAFEAMADRALAILGKEHEYRAPPVQMIVNVDYDTLLGKAGRAVELGSREPLCGEAARRLACDAGISRHITKGDSLILDKGRTTRIATPAQREAVWARDGGCTFPGSDTDVWLVAAVCDFHHHLCHEGGWHVEADRHTGHQTWVDPAGGRHRANQRGLSAEAERTELVLTA